MGIETPLTGRPSHTTVHTDPYTAIRLVKAGTDKKQVPPYRVFQNATLPTFQLLLH